MDLNYTVSFNRSFCLYDAKDAVKDEMLDGFTENINLLNATIDNTMELKAHDMTVFSERIISRLYDGESSLEVQTIFKQYNDLHPED